MPDLSSALLKIDQADIHLQTIEESILDFLNGNSHFVRIEPHDDEMRHQESEWEHHSRSEVERLGLESLHGFRWISQDEGVAPRILFEYSDIYLSLASAFETIAPYWGAMVGDVIHNLRSALDHLVYALTVKHSAEPPQRLTHRSDWWRHVGFPIRRLGSWELDYFGNPAHIEALHGVEPRLWARFRDLQPRGKDVERQPLWVLNTLWNWDKHRLIPFVATNVEFMGIDTLPIGQSQEFDTEVVEVTALGPAIDGAHLALVKVTPRFHPEITDRNIEVYMNARVRYEVAFAQGPPAYGGIVYDTLKEMSALVRSIVGSFADEFP